MRLWLILCCAAALLSGCGVDAWVNRMNAERFQKACVGYGFQPNTTAFSNCMMQQSAQNEEANQRIQDRAALDEAAEKLKKGK
jgi:hypothetical protein